MLSEGYAARDSSRFVYGYGYFVPEKGALAGDLRHMGADVQLFAARSAAGIVARVPKIARFLKSWRADVIHCHLPLAGLAGRLAARLTGVPVVYTEHNYLERYHPWSRRANLATWRLQDFVVAVSEEVADSIRRHAGTVRPVRVVRNGVSLDRFTPDLGLRRQIRNELGIPSSSPVVGTVAVFRPQKCLDLWLQTARTVADEHPDTHFLIVGDGPLRGRLHTRSEELGLGDKVHWAGLQNEVKPFLSAMDVYLMSSSHEGMPVALLEAAASALPVVSTAVGGVPEVVVSGETGFLVPPEAGANLAPNVLRLLRDEELRRRFGRLGRERVRDHFSMDRMVGILESIYRNVLEERRQYDSR